MHADSTGGSALIKNTTRRHALATMAMSLTAGATLSASGIARADIVGPTILPAGASTLKELTRELAKAPRRRDFKSVPTILTRHDEWDAEALTDYFETLPPGLLAKQMAGGGTIMTGNMTWTVKPDAYFAGLNQVKSLIERGDLVGPPVSYVTNELAIMVANGNPLRIAGLADLARPDVKLAMPNPTFEGVARQIQASLVKAGGEALKDEVYERKVKDGSAILTQIHHRQTPLYIMQGKVDAGVTWQSEVAFQEQAGHPISAVRIPPEQNTAEIYSGAAVRGAAHPQAARDWLDFIRSLASLEIFARYGFKAYREGGNTP